MGLTQKLGTIPLAIQTDSSNNVGIGGAANASYKLAVTGASLFSSSIGATSATFSDTVAITLTASDSRILGGNSTGRLLLANSGTSTYGIFYGASHATAPNAISFATDNTERLRITNSGNVGIGTTVPQYSLALPQDSKIGWNDAGSAKRGSITVNSSADAMVFTTGTSDTERMRITSTGNVGIGTTNPVEALQVTGNIRVSNRYYINDGTNTLELGANYIQAYLNSGAASTNLSFYTGTAERMRITSGGSVGMGTNNPQARLQVNGTSGASIAFQINDETDTRRCFFIANQYYGYMWAVSVVANGGKAMSFGNAGGASEVGSIVANASSTTYNTSSDYRLKEDLKDFDGLDILSKIKFYDFKWKSEDARTTGVIAHELQEVVPYAVQGEKDEIGKDDKPSYQGVDYSKLVAIMGKAIQELSAKVTALENK